MNEKKILEKVQKLLALSNNNSSDSEAINAYAKAQELLAKYSLELSEDCGEELELITKACTHSNNEGYRKQLGVIIADNFRVKCFMHGQTVTMFGIKEDVEVAVEVYNHAYKYSHNRGLRMQDKARKEGRNTHGITNSYWVGFMRGLKDVLSVQCKALMIVTPTEVDDAFERRSKTWKPSKGGVGSYRRNEHYEKGYAEGYEFGNNRKSVEANSETR